MKKHKEKIILRSMLLVIFTITFLACFARAGGDSSGALSIWKYILFLILLPFILIYLAIQNYYLNRRKKSAMNMIEKLTQTDPIWNIHDMTARAEEIFLKVQNAWMERNMDLAKDCISERLYTKYKFQTDDMLSRGVKNILQDIQIRSVTIFSVSDFKNNNQDSFSARIEGLMLDYEFNESTNAVTKGDKEKKHAFEDIWIFIRRDNTWIADEVKNSVSIGSIREGKAFTEG